MKINSRAIFSSSLVISILIVLVFAVIVLINPTIGGSFAALPSLPPQAKACPSLGPPSQDVAQRCAALSKTPAQIKDPEGCAIGWQVCGFPVLYQFNGDMRGDLFGSSVASRDINNDGKSDIIVGAPHGNAGGFIVNGYVRVFNGATGAQLYQFNGTTVGSEFGFSVAAGDVNNDSKADIIVCAYTGDTGGFGNNGYAEVLDGATGAQLYQFNGTTSGDLFGSSVAAGDVNGDGISDIIAGASRGSIGGVQVGYVRVFDGSTGTLLYQFNGTSSFEFFDVSVAAGDVNNDSKADIIVGALGGDTGGFTNNGYAKVLDGATGAQLYQFNGTTSGDQFGSSVASRDINNDGKSDIIVGARFGNAGGFTGNGYVRVFNGATGAQLYQFNGTASFDSFGFSVAAGDVNNDSKADIIVGAYAGDTGGFTNNGYASVFDGATGTLLVQLDGSAAEDKLGWSAASGDVNGDGISDVILGALQLVVGNGYIRVYAGG